MSAEQEGTKAAGVDPTYFNNEIADLNIEAAGAGVATTEMEMHDNPLLRDPDEEQGQVDGDGEEGQVEAAAATEEDTIAEEVHAEPNNDDDDDADIEMSHIYKDSATNVIPIHQNPMHEQEDEGVNDRNITTVKAQNMELKSKVADLEFKNKNVEENRADVVSQNQVLVSQIQVLQQRVQDLESQAKDYQEKDNEENLWVTFTDSSSRHIYQYIRERERERSLDKVEKSTTLRATRKTLEWLVDPKVIPRDLVEDVDKMSFLNWQCHLRHRTDHYNQNSISYVVYNKYLFKYFYNTALTSL